MPTLGLRLEYDIGGGRPDPIAIAFTKTDENGTEDRLVVYLAPDLAIHYGELLVELGRRAIVYQVEPED